MFVSFLVGNMPSFSDVTCPEKYVSGLLCIKVNFASGGKDLLILKKNSKYTYEGYMEGDTEVVVTMIESLKEKERLVTIYKGFLGEYISLNHILIEKIKTFHCFLVRFKPTSTRFQIAVLSMLRPTPIL